MKRLNTHSRGLDRSKMQRHFETTVQPSFESCSDLSSENGGWRFLACGGYNRSPTHFTWLQPQLPSNLFSRRKPLRPSVKISNPPSLLVPNPHEERQAADVRSCAAYRTVATGLSLYHAQRRRDMRRESASRLDV